MLRDSKTSSRSYWRPWVVEMRLRPRVWRMCLGLAGDGLGTDVTAVAVCVNGSDGLLIELGEEDVGDGVMDGVGCVFEEVRQADVEAAFAESDGSVEGGEASETDIKRRDGSAGPEIAVLLFEDRDKGRLHDV